MRVLFVSMWTRWPPLYETELELMQQHLDVGDEVIQLGCCGELLACDFNIYHTLDRCKWCRGSRACGLELLDGRVEQRSLLSLTAAQRAEIRGLPQDFPDMGVLKAYFVEGFDIGYAVLSSLISAARDPHVNVSSDRTMVARFMMSALAVYRSVQNVVAQQHFDRVYVFNTRFAATRAVFRACQSRKVDCICHDRGHDLNHYELYPNAFPHDVDLFVSRAKAAWNAAGSDPQARREQAASFYRNTAAGIGYAWYSFAAEQRQGLLPTDWDPSRRNVALFTSSDDEFACVSDDWGNPIYANQVDGLEAIARSLRDQEGGFRLYVRIHPNLKGVDNLDARRTRALKGDCVTVIPPEDPVSSYALLHAASAVMTFGSTMGIEAVFWGKPSILAGKSFYRQLGGTYQPKNHEELMRLLVSDLPPQDETPALIYGYYLATYGLQYQHYQPKDVGSGTFNGVDLVEKEHILRSARDQRLKWMPLKVRNSMQCGLDCLHILTTRYHVCRHFRIYKTVM